MNRTRRVVGDRVQLTALAVEVAHEGARIPAGEVSRTTALLAVPACQLAGCRLVVAFERVEGLVRDADLENGQVEYSHERVTGANPVVEERQRLVGRVALQPKGHAAEVHSQRILVDAVDAMGDDFPGRLADPLGCWFVFARVHAGQFPSQAPCRGQQEMP
jgi:hypothetical protein